MKVANEISSNSKLKHEADIYKLIGEQSKDYMFGKQRDFIYRFNHLFQRIQNQFQNSINIFPRQMTVKMQFS